MNSGESSSGSGTADANGNCSKTESQALKWNSAELSGGDARQSKFLRLLGAGKSGALSNVSKQDDTGSSRFREQELEKQFNAGIKIKNEPNGKRRGLGA